MEDTRVPNATTTTVKQSDIEKQLRATEQRYQAFIHNSLEGIWRYELDEPIPIELPPAEQIDLVFRHAYLAETNDAMAQMYGLKSSKQLIGSRLGDLLDRDVPQNIEYLEAFIASGYNLHGVESQENDAQGNTKFFLNSLVGIIENGMIQRAWGTQLDVTKQHMTVAALRESQERLDLALKASRLGMWEYNVVTDALTWSAELRKIFNVSSRAKVTYDSYIACIHPEDRAVIQKTIAESMQSGKPYEVDHRIVWSNGAVHWIYSRGQAFLENGKPVRMTGTCLNIDERKAAEALKVKNALLNTERKELVRLNKSKDDFIALASHQLRTPATGVKQYLGMLLEGYTGELDLTETQMDMLKTAYESNERQIEIVNDLLLIATIDAGKMKLKKHEIDLVAFLDEIVSDHSWQYANKKQKLDFKHSDPAVTAAIDEVRLRMALENLIDNASKYSPEGSTTILSVTSSAENVEISVTDQGVGIDKKDFNKLFQKFSRIPNALSTSEGGSGLGLYWANKIVELHDGTLTVDSAPGKGSEFKVTLPR